MSPTVHVLHYGRVLCGAVHGEPRGWGEQHRWTWMHDLERVTCAECKRCAKLWVEQFVVRWDRVTLPPAGPVEENPLSAQLRQGFERGLPPEQLEKVRADSVTNAKMAGPVEEETE